MKKIENKGITLIALIVTIIVLIILAGVAIAMLNDDNGILKNANEARATTLVAEYKERVTMAQMGIRTDIARESLVGSYIASGTSNFTKLAENDGSLTIDELETFVNKLTGLNDDAINNLCDISK